MLNSKGEKVCPGCNYEVLKHSDQICVSCVMASEGTIKTVEELEKIIKSIDSLSYFIFSKYTSIPEMSIAANALLSTKNKIKDSKQYKIEMMSKYSIQYDL